MLIKKIQIENLRFTAGSQQHSAVVILTTDHSTLCLTGRTALKKTAPSAEIRTALIADAVRQVGQMPEFRSGQQQITLGHRAAPPLRRSA